MSSMIVWRGYVMKTADDILARMEEGYAITAMEAWARFRCANLRARIWELKARGWEIESEMVKTLDGKRIAKYWLKGERERAVRAAIA